MGAVNQCGRPRGLEAAALEWGRLVNGKSPHGAADAEVLLQPASTTDSSASSSSPARPPGWPT